uniref:Uncharacterized protein n=1 Tax=Rhizophora mucronata TaxID=61149 RepID=A0A2P2Q4X5_RHIMU
MVGGHPPGSVGYGGGYKGSGSWLFWWWLSGDKFFCKYG